LITSIVNARNCLQKLAETGLQVSSRGYEKLALVVQEIRGMAPAGIQRTIVSSQGSEHGREDEDMVLPDFNVSDDNVGDCWLPDGWQDIPLLPGTHLSSLAWDTSLGPYN
jgi:hypothetical protein